MAEQEQTRPKLEPVNCSRRKKVLICSRYFFPSVGGVQEYTRLLADGLARSGQSVVVSTATPRDGFDDRQFLFEVVRQPRLGKLWGLIGDADVVHLNGPVLLPLLLALGRRKPVVTKQHGYQTICPNGLLFYEPTKIACPGHFMARRFHKCLRCNAVSVGWLKSLWMLLGTFPHRWLCKAAVNVPVTFHVEQRLALPRCKVIYHGIPEPPAPALQRVTLGAPSRAVCFAYVGRLVSEKGLPLLMEAVAQLRRRGRELSVKFIGEGPERERLEGMADTMGLRDSVVFTGFLSGNALEGALKDVTALVMPTIMEETAGLAVIEQMMRRRLVIVSDIGGLAELVGSAGLKFPPGDLEGLVRCMELAMDQPEQGNELAGQARERALQLFRQEKMVENYLELYARLAEERAWCHRGEPIAERSGIQERGVMQRVISALANLVPQRFKLRLIGEQGHPSKFANAAHALLNCLPGERFPVLSCRGALEGYRMRISWRARRSYIYGTYEPRVVKAISDVVQPGMVAFDIGANAGFYTLLLSRLVGPGGLVVAFEPLPTNFRTLEENILINQCPNVQAINKAVADRSGDVGLALPDPNSAQWAGPPPDRAAGAGILASAISLDDFLAQAKLPVHFLKVDVEGAEGAVLGGARRTIEIHHPPMVIELHDVHIRRRNHPVLEQVRGLGYEVEHLDDGKYCVHILARWRDTNGFDEPPIRSWQ